METERDATSPNGKSAVRLDAIDQCIVVLNVSPDSHVCTEVFRSLIRSRDARAVIPIVKALPRFQTLGYESESRIKKELIAFGAIAVPPLMQLCTSDKIRLRRYAVELLGELREAQALPALRQALWDPDNGVRHKTVLALVHFPPELAQPLLLSALHDTDATVRDVAVMVLDRPAFWKRSEVIEALLLARNDPSGRVRGRVLRALSATHDPRISGCCIEGLLDDHEFVRACAARALGRIRESRAIPLLLHALQDTSLNVQENAAEALVEFGTRDALATALLACPQLSHATKLDALTALIQVRFHFNHIQADYRVRSLAHYCGELERKKLPPAARQALQGVLEVKAHRKDGEVLLRASDLNPKTQELLRPAKKTQAGDRPEEMLRSSQSEETPAPSRLPWHKRLFKRQA